MSTPDRDHRSNRKQIIRDNARAHSTAGIESEPEDEHSTDLDALDAALRATLPAGAARKAWDASGTPGAASLILAQKVVMSRMVTILGAEKRASKALQDPDPDTRKSAASYLAELRRGTSQLNKLVGLLISAAKCQSDLDVDQLPEEIRIIGADVLSEAFTMPGPSQGDEPAPRMSDE